MEKNLILFTFYYEREGEREKERKKKEKSSLIKNRKCYYKFSFKEFKSTLVWK